MALINFSKRPNRALIVSFTRYNELSSPSRVIVQEKLLSKVIARNYEGFFYYLKTPPPLSTYVKKHHIFPLQNYIDFFSMSGKQR